MAELQAEVRKGVLSIRQITKMPSGSKNYLSVRFNFDDEWVGIKPEMVCYRDIGHQFQIPVVNNVATIPQEVSNERGVITIGVFGSIGDMTISSTISKVMVQSGALTKGMQLPDGVVLDYKLNKNKSETDMEVAHD